MACRLTGGLAAIVTVCALSWHRAAVVVTRPQESEGIEVTCFARRISHDMAGGFRRGHYALAECMTAVAVFRRAFEDAADVAGFACCCGMHACQRETGSHVIEVTPTQLRLSHHLHRNHG